MPGWALILIISGLYFLLFSALTAGILITAFNRIHKANLERDEALKRAFQAEQLLDAYGIKEIDIGEKRH